VNCPAGFRGRAPVEACEDFLENRSFIFVKWPSLWPYKKTQIDTDVGLEAVVQM